MQPSENIKHQVLEQLSAFKALHASEYKIHSLGVFGSVARGEARINSDVDVVFETEFPDLFTTSLLKQELERALSRPVDLVRLRVHMNLRLKERIIREAIFV